MIHPRLSFKLIPPPNNILVMDLFLLEVGSTDDGFELLLLRSVLNRLALSAVKNEKAAPGHGVAGNSRLVVLSVVELHGLLAHARRQGVQRVRKRGKHVRHLRRERERERERGRECERGTWRSTRRNSAPFKDLKMESAESLLSRPPTEKTSGAQENKDVKETQ